MATSSSFAHVPFLDWLPIPQALMSDSAVAFILSVVASMGTFVGGIVVILLVKALGTDTRGQGAATLMGVLQAFSAGVMLYMTFFDLIPECSAKIGSRETVGWFFCGVFAFVILEKWVIPEDADEDIFKTISDVQKVSEEPAPIPADSIKTRLRKRVPPSSSSSAVEKEKEPPVTPPPTKNSKANEQPDLATAKGKRELWRTSLITFAAMALHNLPEGLGVYLSTLADFKLGLQLTVAIMLHNIPEGMAVAIPLYVATDGSVWKVLWMTLLNGLAEPAGVIIGAAILKNHLTPQVLSCCLAGVAGIMACISLHELQPTAVRYAGRDLASFAVFGGMFVCWIAMESVDELMGDHGHHH